MVNHTKSPLEPNLQEDATLGRMFPLPWRIAQSGDIRDVNWELSAVPYWPIHRRRVLRQRLFALAIAAAVFVPAITIRARLNAEPIGQRVFDTVSSTISYRYFDANFRGVAWNSVIDTYRPLVVNAPSTSERYALLRSMLARLGDSHTAVFSPIELRTSAASANRLTTVTWRDLSHGIGYVRVGSFPDNIAEAIGWALQREGGRAGVVLDLRGNPGGIVDSVDATAGAFLPVGTLLSSAQGRWRLLPVRQFKADAEAGVTYRGPLVVLVDGATSSGAETLARALQYYHRATIVGTHTAGKVMGVEVEMPLADGGLLRVATLDVAGPDGRRLEGRGVMPDVVSATRAGQMRTALSVLRRRIPIHGEL
jgi:C-terminal processing protease CtpA/Prc